MIIIIYIIKDNKRYWNNDMKIYNYDIVVLWTKIIDIRIMHEVESRTYKVVYIV